MTKMHGPGILPREKGTEAHLPAPHLSLCTRQLMGQGQVSRKKRQSGSRYTSFKKVEKRTMHFADFPGNPVFGAFNNPE